MKAFQFGGSYSISGEESRRISALKFISMLLVVMIHAYDMELAAASPFSSVMDLEYLISQILARSAVPLFFLLSGVLLFRHIRSYSAVLREKSRTLLLPYILWNCFWILVFIILQSLPFTRSLFGADSVPILQRSPFQWLQLFGIGAREPQDYPLWFLRDLMVMILVSPLIWKLADRMPRLTLVLGLALTLSWPNRFVFSISLPYMLLAAWVVKSGAHMSSLDRFPMAAWAAVYAAAAAAAFFIRILPVQRAAHLIGVLFWLRASALFRGKPLQLLLKGAPAVFMIFAAHELTLTFLRKLWGLLIPQSSATVLLGYFLLPAAVITLCILADHITKKLLPGFHRIITGGR